MAKADTYEANYSNTWALIIGIDSYEHSGNLEFATNDANGLSEVLTKKFGFPKENISLLLNEKATAAAVRKTFLSYSKKVKPNDRLLVFFAGHGHTLPGRRGEVGFLVPHDGKADEPDSLIRWDELTRNADLIPAKHIFFIMDACYGGLAINRGNAFGSMRFAKDMLQRYARQVLTAGKADEVVTDGSGVRPGHSIFTAHLLNGLEGNAATEDGIITASGVMGYVYEKVGTDQYSHQTPAYGFLDGDGDFIFDTAVIDRLIAETESQKPSPEKKEIDEAKVASDVLINVTSLLPAAIEGQSDLVTTLKELLSSPEKRIQLDDFISHHVRRFLEKADLRHFPVDSREAGAPEQILERIRAYEELAKDLQQIVILLATWGDADQLKQLEKIFTRLAETDKGSSGLVVLIKLSWYPLMFLMYSAGIAAIAKQNYLALKIVLTTSVQTETHSKCRALVIPVMSNLSDVHDTFKILPGHENQYVPRSEYLFKSLQPILEDFLFLGRRYEDYFDDFEVFVAFSYTYETERGWGPPGRFAWKHSSRGHEESPYARLLNEAKLKNESWEPFRIGLFAGLEGRFQEQTEAYGERLNNLGWL